MAQTSGNQPRRAITITAIVTAVVTFLATQTAGWLFGRVADQIAVSATPSIHVQSSDAQSDADKVVVPQEPGRLEGVRVRDGAAETWSKLLGGGPADSVSVQLTIWGLKDEPILLQGLQATDVRCDPPPAWTLVRAKGGGDVSPRAVRVDLDSPEKLAVPLTDPVTGDTFSFPLQVSKASLELLTVLAVSSNSCSFRLKVLHGPAGGPESYTLDDHGEPFRIVSSSAAVAEMEWVSDPERGFDFLRSS